MNRMRLRGVVGFGIMVAMLCLAMEAHGDDQNARVQDFWDKAWSDARKPYFSGLGMEAPSDGQDWRYADRVKMTSEVHEYVAKLSSLSVLMEQPDLQDYMQRVLLTVHPGPLAEGHPGALRVRIVESATPNAAAFSEGTILVNVGLLTLLRDEDELAAVLAHEVAHVVLDHNMANYQSAKSREGLAIFLGAMAGVAAGVLSSRSSDPAVRYNAASIAAGSFVLGTTLSVGVLELVGAKFSRDQEKAADRLAQEYLRASGRDTLALGRALRRLRAYGQMRGVTDQASLADDHPSLEKRLSLLPKLPAEDISQDKAYDGGVVVALDRQARLLLHLGRYVDCKTVCDRIVSSGWADGRAHVLRAAAQRLSSNDASGIQMALGWLDAAENQHGYSDADLHIERAMLRMRAGNEVGATAALQIAEARLKEQVEAERRELSDWVRSMVSRLKGRVH
ncbi:MAG: hypothetical protein RLZZ221_2208 [Verrucomicrobiota bacterium]|jgi:Zn-dependent protease with chaperone function